MYMNEYIYLLYAPFVIQRQPKIDLRPPTAIRSNYRNHLFANVNVTHWANVSPQAKEFIFTAHSGASTIAIETSRLKQTTKAKFHQYTYTHKSSTARRRKVKRVL